MKNKEIKRNYTKNAAEKEQKTIKQIPADNQTPDDFDWTSVDWDGLNALVKRDWPIIEAALQTIKNLNN